MVNYISQSHTHTTRIKFRMIGWKAKSLTDRAIIMELKAIKDVHLSHHRSIKHLWWCLRPFHLHLTPHNDSLPINKSSNWWSLPITSYLVSLLYIYIYIYIYLHYPGTTEDETGNYPFANTLQKLFELQWLFSIQPTTLSSLPFSPINRYQTTPTTLPWNTDNRPVIKPKNHVYFRQYKDVSFTVFCRESEAMTTKMSLFRCHSWFIHSVISNSFLSLTVSSPENTNKLNPK